MKIKSNCARIAQNIAQEYYKTAAIKYNSTDIIIFHNHPSGDVSPSEADIEITKRLKKAGQLLGIEVLDHIIFEKRNRFYSFENQ
ncbi:hypothetical protein KAI65_02525 [Candidatus Parcubacteria bacterium]|nr:hypothetical protein [Candidatus Parcubacteria bacterium]